MSPRHLDHAGRRYAFWYGKPDHLEDLRPTLQQAGWRVSLAQRLTAPDAEHPGATHYLWGERNHADVVRDCLHKYARPCTAAEIVTFTGLGWNEVDASLLGLGCLADDGEVRALPTHPESFIIRS